MAPPTKRRKRSAIVESSSSSSEYNDDEEATPKEPTARVIDLVSSSPAPKQGIPSTPKKVQSTLNLTPTKVQLKPNTANIPHKAAPFCLPNRDQTKRNGIKSASSSPEKGKGGKTNRSEKGKSRDLYTFFSTKAQTQRSQSTVSAPSQNIPIVQEHTDEISDDDEVGEVKALPSSIVGAAARKRARSALPGDAGTITGSQKFMREPSFRPEVRVDEDLRPWAERFAPNNMDELAVHKKKVADVRGWLESVMTGKLRQRVLVLKGAAGTGKTTTVQLLAKEMGCEILEWRNPSGSVASADGFVSMAAQFEEFISRGGKFGQLEIFSENMEALSNRDINPLDRRKTIILVEEFPNTFTRSSTALNSFRSAILQYLASNTPRLSSMYNRQPNNEPITPLIMVISETLLTTSTASADSFTAHRLLGPEILQHPGATAMEFNAIAPTLLAKALELVVVKEARKSGRRKTPGPQVLKRLGDIGDVRSAIGSLEFLCLRGDESADWGAKVAFTKGKKVSKETPMTKMETKSLELVTRREASLGIFHAVGRVVYNKREEHASADDVEKLPEWQSQNSRH
jgi:cell cycle checkpoint protein